MIEAIKLKKQIRWVKHLTAKEERRDESDERKEFKNSTHDLQFLF